MPFFGAGSIKFVLKIGKPALAWYVEEIARLRAAQRRSGAAPDSGVVRTPDFEVDLGRKRVVTTAGEEVHLTPTEWGVLEVLVRAGICRNTDVAARAIRTKQVTINGTLTINNVVLQPGKLTIKVGELEAVTVEIQKAVS